MPWHLVDGVALPDQVAGHPALEFCNTRAGWGAPDPKEYLVSPRALLLWAFDVGLLPTLCADPPTLPESAVAQAIRLREAVYLCAVGTGRPGDWGRVGAAAAHARQHAVLRPGPAGAPATWQLDPPIGTAGHTDPAQRVLDAVALAAESLLTSAAAAAVTACSGQGCGWLFLDPRRRRRWCTMAVCGNRAKARRYAERVRG